MRARAGAESSVRPSRSHAPAPANAYYGFNHICLTVEDLDEALRDAEAKGAIIAEPVFHLPSGRGFFLEAPDGTELSDAELRQ